MTARPHHSKSPTSAASLRFSIFHQNGFHGFQPMPFLEDYIEKFAICIINETPDGGEWAGGDELDKIKQESGLKTIYNGWFIGNDYLIIGPSEIHLATTLLSTLLRLGYSFQTCTKNLPPFGPKDNSNTGFTHELLEERVIHQIRELIHLGLTRIVDPVFGDSWNYITPSGKIIATEVKKCCNEPIDQQEMNNYYKWDVFNNIDFLKMTENASYQEGEGGLCQTTITTNTNNNNNNNNTNDPEVKSNAKIDDDKLSEKDNTLCVICCVNVADTMVLPCEHNVVCKICSLQLEGTNNSDRCVLCRGQITHKLQ